jgi:hypothetical protein
MESYAPIDRNTQLEQGCPGRKDAPDAKIVSRALIAHASPAPVRGHFPTQAAAIFGKTNSGSGSGEVLKVANSSDFP